MSNIKVNGPQDAIVSEMIKQLPMEKFTLSRSVFRTLLGPDGISKFLEGGLDWSS